MGPLQGVKVVDLTRILAGPWATQALADYGAEVIKIERPVHGDDTRLWGPPYLHSLKASSNRNTSESNQQQKLAGYFLSANRGKQSVALDISNPKHQDIIKKLMADADVVIENFKVGGLAKYGLDYDSIKTIKADIIYCSITGFGQTGPDAHKAGYDAMIQARGGLMSITGEQQAQKAGVAVADLMTGMYALSAILAALHHRHQTGIGQSIDLALLDTQVAWLANQNLNYLLTKQVPQRHGTAHPNIVPYQSFTAADGEFMLAVGNDRQFIALCRVLGIASVAFDERFGTNSARVKNRNALLPILQREFLTHPSEFWLEALGAANVACGPINDLQAVFADEQVKHRNMQFDFKDDVFGEIPMVANPVKFSQTPIDYQRPPPILGADTKAILERLGIDDEL